MLIDKGADLSKCDQVCKHSQSYLMAQLDKVQQ